MYLVRDKLAVLRPQHFLICIYVHIGESGEIVIDCLMGTLTAAFEHFFARIDDVQPFVCVIVCQSCNSVNLIEITRMREPGK